MSDQPDHIRIYDANAKPFEPAPEPAPPARTPSIVLGEFFRAIVHHLGNHPILDRLLTEYEDLTQAPVIENPPAPTEVSTE